MSHLQLDFLHPRRRRSRAAVVFLVAGLCLASVSLWRHAVLASAVQVLQQRIADITGLQRRERAPMGGSVGQTDRHTAQEFAYAKSVLSSLTLPWNDIFSELESVADAQIVLLAIQPEADGRRVRIGGEAGRFEHVLTYVARLEATSGFDNVFLVSHEDRGASGTPTIAFTLVADWRERP